REMCSSSRNGIVVSRTAAIPDPCLDEMIFTTHRLAILVISSALVACGSSGEERFAGLPTADQVRAEQASAPSQTTITRSELDQDRLKRGARLWRTQCQRCHQIGAGARHAAGPQLWQIVGREAGTAAGFGYSKALGEGGFVWTGEALNAWLAGPWRFLPGTSMQYGGLSRAEDRLAIIEFLQHGSR
ncbi:MAG: c-type cytochrome, partial [Pseudomonadota bacterium]